MFHSNYSLIRLLKLLSELITRKLLLDWFIQIETVEQREPKSYTNV